MKRLCLFLCLMLAAQFTLWAQLVSDPNDPLYTWISVWEEKGYTQKLPPLRPYPIQLVRQILRQVEQNAPGEDADRARSYLEKIDVTIGDHIPGRSIPAPLSFSLENESWTTFSELRTDALASLIIQGSLSDIVSFSGKLSWGGMAESSGFYGPEWMSFSDESASGGGNEEIFGVRMWAKNLGVGGMAIGSQDLYFQAGLMRSSFGPFFENGAVIGPQAPAAGHFSLNFTADWIRVSSILMVLQPKYYSDNYTGVPFNSAFEKYLVIHSYTFTPCDWFEFGILQSVVFGGRFNPVYLLPFAHMFFAQQIYGDDDSSFLGLFARVKLPWDLQFKAMLYIDDFNTDTFFGTDGRSGFLSLDNAQNKVAIQAGFTWTPDQPVLKRMSLDYLMVTPYTYTHYDKIYQDTYSMFSYTHLGEGIGTILEPNSDQITLTAFLQPLSWWSVDVMGRFARHGNASEGFTSGDGSYFDNGFQAGVATFIGPARFLTQDVLEYVFQLGLELGFEFSLDWTELSLGVGYMFEYVQNKDLVEGAREFNHFVNFRVKFTI
jgi:hypothetical protein